MKRYPIDEDLWLAHFSVERALGKIRPTTVSTPPSTAEDYATLVCREITLAPEPPVCPTITAFYDLSEKLKAFLGLPQLSIRPDTSLRVLLGRKTNWAGLEKLLNAPLPTYVQWDGLFLFFVVALAMQSALLPFLTNFKYPFLYFPGSLILSFLEMVLLRIAFSKHLPRLMAGQFQSVGDLACYLALRPDVRRERGTWSRSEVRLLIRYALAGEMGMPVQSVRLRDEYTSFGIKRLRGK